MVSDFEIAVGMAETTMSPLAIGTAWAIATVRESGRRICPNIVHEGRMKGSVMGLR
jgi:hypothetical protein